MPSAVAAQSGGEGVVGAGSGQPRQEGADRGRDPGGSHQRPEGRHVDARQEQQGDVHDDGLSRDRERADGQPADGAGHLDQHRAQEEAEHAGDRGGSNEPPG